MRKPSFTQCVIDGCEKPMTARHLCVQHYLRWRKYNDPYCLMRRKSGTGTFTANGYLQRTKDGKTKGEHVHIAEMAIGRPLPKDAEVHHIDGDRLNNANENLIICPSRAYHMLLHQRQRALDESGDASNRKCPFCKSYSKVDDLIKIGSSNRSGFCHKQCRIKYDKSRRLREIRKQR